MTDRLVTVFAANGFTAEMEAQAVHGLLQANGITSLVVRDNVPELPVGKVEVRVVEQEAAQAEEIIREARAAGAPAVEQVETESEI
jgi:hypothetical protein